MTPFVDMPVDGFTLLTSFTFPAAKALERRWLQNDRVNALRQTTMYDFRGRVTTSVSVFGNTSFIGQIRATPCSWVWAVSNNGGPLFRFWDSSGVSWMQGIPIGGPSGFKTYRNSSVPIYIPLDEPWFLPDGVINWEQHFNFIPVCFMMAEPRAEIRGELLSACSSKKGVEF